MIKSHDLENRAFDKNEPKGAEAVHADQARVTGPGPKTAEARALAAFRARIVALRAEEEIDPAIWEQVRAAFLRALDPPAS